MSKVITEEGIKIDKGVPVPEHKIGGNPVWPFYKMDVGDSFEIPENKAKACNSAAFRYGRAHLMKFIKRENRIWRIK